MTLRSFIEAKKSDKSLEKGDPQKLTGLRPVRVTQEVSDLLDRWRDAMNADRRGNRNLLNYNKEHAIVQLMVLGVKGFRKEVAQLEAKAADTTEIV